jgi:signal transduction histidine kinase/ligand-binding sensor domain-containing protein
MEKLFFRITCCLILLSVDQLQAQEPRFNQVLKNNTGQIMDMAQDKQGFLWIATFDQGLKRYDGITLKGYTNDLRNPNSITAGNIISIYIDANNMIWMGMLGSGLEKFDPASNTFTHFRHDPKDSSSLSNDTVSSVVEDDLGNLWVGTLYGLDMLDTKTGKFIHYRHDVNDPSSISNNEIFKICKDKKGVLWVGCYPIEQEKAPGTGGLNRFDVTTRKFTRYLHDPSNPNSIGDNRIAIIYEDKQDNLWVVTRGAGFNKMDRNTGRFIRYYADPVNPGPLSTTPVSKGLFPNVSSISEDATGALWIGIGYSGMNKYDPLSKKSAHYGPVYDGDKLLSVKDTATGFNGRTISKGLSTKDGLFWVSTYEGALFNLDNNKTTVAFYKIRQDEANSFYCEENNNILWIGTANGLLRKDLTIQDEKLWKHDPKDNNSLCFNKISSIKADDEGHLWLGTRGGLDKFDPVTEKFIHFKHDPKDPASVSDSNFNYLFFDHQKNLWAASDSGISRLDTKTGLFTNYRQNSNDSTGLTGIYFLCITEDKDQFIWVASNNGAFRLDTKTGKFRKYISNSFIKSICVDSKGIIWAGGELGIYYYDKGKDIFILFADQQSEVGISNVINIIEDDKNNLWVSTGASIIKINETRTKLKKYTDANGVRYSNFLFNDNFKGTDGRLFLGEAEGYYAFYPDQLKDSSIAPHLIISGFKLGDKELKITPAGILTAPIWQTGEIRLKHNQNIFSFDFLSVDFISPGDEKYLFMLENYDDTWHDIGSDHRAFFFNVPPGTYVFRVKVINGNGDFSEKNIRVIISPPWWKTWWAYSLYALLIIMAGYFIYKYQKYYIVKRERERTQQKELAQAREIEKAYTELKTTQAQLIQSEKMASLGELTAGIAHEIQNPLNFVNNFSEVNGELIGEMKDELSKGNIEGAKNIANSINENEQKIIFHGKRADAIVKGMLQHSRSNNGVKEPTDINKLADEYLRLAYHGLRAKDKSFNATMKTDFDESVGNINIVPQEIGRVILNLITNAFYVVDEKKKQLNGNFEPTVSLSTKRVNGKVEIKVKDNGNGISQRVLDKIFQPFFTTKPTGQGTGLGLSLSYDIVKAHGGELKVETKENEGSVFTIVLS